MQMAPRISYFLQHPSPGQGALIAVLKEPCWVDFFLLKYSQCPTLCLLTSRRSGSELWSGRGQVKPHVPGQCPTHFEGGCDVGKVRWYIWPLQLNWATVQKEIWEPGAPRRELYSLRTIEFTKRLAIEQDLPKCIISMQLPEVYYKTQVSNFSET